MYDLCIFKLVNELSEKWSVIVNENDHHLLTRTVKLFHTCYFMGYKLNGHINYVCILYQKIQVYIYIIYII